MPIRDDDEELRGWEMKDEEPPESLRRKWEQEEARGSRKVLCRSCKKETSAGNLTCIFCGAEIFEEGPLQHLFDWIKRLFRKN